MNALLSKFVKNVQGRQFENLQRRTKRITNVADREHLKNIITNSGTTACIEEEDDDDDDETQKIDALNRGDDDDDDDDDEEDLMVEDDYILLQRDIDKANSRLEALESKRLFLQTRLQAYHSKIQNAEEFISSSNTNNMNNVDDDDHHRHLATTMKEKVQTYKLSLEPVEQIYQQIVEELLVQQSKLESMQLRQLDLQLKTQECNVVLHELLSSNTNTNANTTNYGVVATVETLITGNNDDDDDDEYNDETITSQL